MCSKHRDRDQDRNDKGQCSGKPCRPNKHALKDRVVQRFFSFVVPFERLELASGGYFQYDRGWIVEVFFVLACPTPTGLVDLEGV